MGIWDKLIGTKARTVYAFFFTAFVMLFILFETPEVMLQISLKGVIGLCLISIMGVVAGFWVAASTVSEDILADMLNRMLKERGV